MPDPLLPSLASLSFGKVVLRTPSYRFAQLHSRHQSFSTMGLKRCCLFHRNHVKNVDDGIQIVVKKTLCAIVAVTMPSPVHGFIL